VAFADQWSRQRKQTMPWDAGCKVLMLAPAGSGPAMTGLQAGMLQQCLHGFVFPAIGS